MALKGRRSDQVHLAPGYPVARAQVVPDPHVNRNLRHPHLQALRSAKLLMGRLLKVTRSPHTL